ncbi:MAG: hypothetical protein HFJ10_09130 [Lachnospiraceae bacterium]|jgi:Na+-driven multidrug efflux pump|nr:hypothetical protein [Lachnospiraceae bacterium]
MNGGIPMTNATFLMLLSSFSVLSSLVTEGVKNLADSKVNLSYNLVSLITALFIGGGGTAIYYQLNAISFTVNNVIYMILMGLASGLVSMVGFDKVKQALEQITGK